MHGRSRVSCKHRQPRCGTCSSSRPGPSCARSRSAMATYTYDVHSLMTISDPTETIQQPWRRVTGTLGVSPRLIPPHSVVKSYTHLASLKYCYISCTFFLYFASVSLMASSRASWFRLLSATLGPRGSRPTPPSSPPAPPSTRSRSRCCPRPPTA